MTHKFSAKQLLRIELTCGADQRSILRYEAGELIRPITAYGIRCAIKALGYVDPRPAAADPADVESKAVVS